MPEAPNTSLKVGAAACAIAGTLAKPTDANKPTYLFMSLPKLFVETLLFISGYVFAQNVPENHARTALFINALRSLRALQNHRNENYHNCYSIGSDAGLLEHLLHCSFDLGVAEIGAATARRHAVLALFRRSGQTIDATGS